MIESFIFELGIVVLLCILISIIMRLLKQPLIMGYIITGILVSPYFLDVAGSSETISILGQFGIAILLFMVGLGLNPKVLKDVGMTALITATGKLVMTVFVSFILCQAFGFPLADSAFISLALSFSSTIIVMKTLYDREESDTLHGKISIGLLIVQDLIAMLILTIVSTTARSPGFMPILLTVIKGAFLFISLFAISKFLLPRFMDFIARSQEFLLVFSVGWCLIVSGLFYMLGFSIEIGALIAGLFLSISEFSKEMSFRLKPIRDFFIVLFFVTLGSHMSFESIQLIPIIAFSLLIIIANPLIVTFFLQKAGYSRKVSLTTGLSLAQVSELSLILVSLGITLGFISSGTMSTITIVALVTIAVSTYMTSYSEKICRFLSRFIRETVNPVNDRDFSRKNDIILFGYNRIGYDILNAIKKKNSSYLIVDYNPDTIKELGDENAIYGDAGDIELLDDLDLAKAKMIISTVPDFETNSMIIRRTRLQNQKAIIIVVSHQINDSLELYETGASYVILPHFLGGHHAAAMIEDIGFDSRMFMKKKLEHIRELQQKRSRGFEHPKHENTERK